MTRLNQNEYLSLIQSEKPTSTAKVYHPFREKRFELATVETRVVFSTMDAAKIEGSVSNISQFGARIHTPSSHLSLQRSSCLTNLEITISDAEVYRGEAAICHVSSSSHDMYIGVALLGDGVDVEHVRAILDSREVDSPVPRIRSLVTQFADVRPEFKVLVADLNTFFQELKTKLLAEEERNRAMALSPKHKHRLDEQTINMALALYANDLHRLFELFTIEASGFTKEETLLHKRYFRANFHPTVLGVPFVRRSFEKPLGYAGDYGLMVMLYEYEDLGQNLFEKFYHRFCCNEPAAVANKNRVSFLSDLLEREYDQAVDGFKVSSIACGPAREIELFLLGFTSTPPLPIEVCCVDHESKALEYAYDAIRRAANQAGNTRWQFFKEDAVLAIIKGRRWVDKLRDSNVITCAGLYDYLSDRLASRLMKSLFDLVAPGGVLLIGNVSNQNPSRFTMSYFAEWELALRSPEMLCNLVPESIAKQKGIEIDVVSESMGLNLFLRVRKPK